MRTEPHLRPPTNGRAELKTNSAASSARALMRLRYGGSFQLQHCDRLPSRDRSLQARADSDLHTPRPRVGYVIARSRPQLGDTRFRHHRANGLYPRHDRNCEPSSPEPLHRGRRGHACCHRPDTGLAKGSGCSRHRDERRMPAVIPCEWSRTRPTDMPQCNSSAARGSSALARPKRQQNIWRIARRGASER
jgi:hypothetical protein